MLKEIYGTSSVREIHEQIIYELSNKDNNIISIYNHFIPFLWQPTSKVLTIRNRYTKLRNMLQENTKLTKKRKDEALETFKIAPSLTIFINDRSDERAKEVINNKIEFGIDGYKEVLNHIKSSLVNKNFDKLRFTTTKSGKIVPSNREENYIIAQYSAVYLAYCTGRRPYEIAKTLEVSKIGKTSYFKNLAKKDESAEKFKAYLIDDDYKFIKSCVKNVKDWANLDELTNIQFNDGKAKTLRNNMKLILEDFEDWKNIDYKTIRDMYSDVAINMYIKDNQDEELLRLAVLAHEPRKLNATDRYRKTKGV